MWLWGSQQAPVARLLKNHRNFSYLYHKLLIELFRIYQLVYGIIPFNPRIMLLTDNHPTVLLKRLYSFIGYSDASIYSSYTTKWKFNFIVWKMFSDWFFFRFRLLVLFNLICFSSSDVISQRLFFVVGTTPNLALAPPTTEFLQDF